jgi:protein TonB
MREEEVMFETSTQLSDVGVRFGSRQRAPGLLSLGIHTALLGLALIPWASPVRDRFPSKITAVTLLLPDQPAIRRLTAPPRREQGGGGGGKQESTPASIGVLPRAADKQLAPPDVAPPKNPDPTLIVEPTLVAPEMAWRPPVSLLNFGDPNGVVGPPSSGPGKGGGIGDGDGHGVGKGDGPGAIDGSGGGCCDGVYRVGGVVISPSIIHRIEPEYSEEARKARHEGTVLLEAIIRKDGRVDLVGIVRRLGFGLDQNAIDALRQWRFRPATMNGVAVDVRLNVEVRFNLR